MPMRPARSVKTMLPPGVKARSQGWSRPSRTIDTVSDRGATAHAALVATTRARVDAKPRTARETPGRMGAPTSESRSPATDDGPSVTFGGARGLAPGWPFHDVLAVLARRDRCGDRE